MNKSLEEQLKICPVAYDIYRERGCGDVMSAFDIANHLHLHGFLKEAADFYKIALDLRLEKPEEHPRPAILLQVRLLCLIKGGYQVEEDELDQLRQFSPTLHSYIIGVFQYYHQKLSAMETMKVIGNTFEEFHTGEEIDAIYLHLVYDCLQSGNFPNKIRNSLIPRRLFFYWDKNIPEDVQENIEYHQKFKSFEVEVFDQEKASDWLYQYYGENTRNIFLKARHPAEAADILRIHVVNLCGGFWVDADLKIRSEECFEQYIRRSYDHVFMLTNGFFIHNDFFGAIANSPILNDCLLSIYRNWYNYEGLFIAYKTGPGVFMRAVNRIYYRCITGLSHDLPSLNLIDHTIFDKVTEQYPVAYKQTGTWSTI